MKLVRSKERTEKYKDRVKAHWNEMYSRNIWNTVHQAGSEEKNINLAKLETEVFLFPTKENVKTLLEDEENNPRPTFGQFLDEHQHLTKYLPDLSNCVALDYGCGSLARYVTSFSPLFKKVIGIDASPAALDYAKQFVESLDNTELVLTDGTNLEPIDSDSVDFVFSNLVFQHVGNKEILVDLIGECCRVLKSGGVMRASFWNEVKEESHESPQHGTGFEAPLEFREVFEAQGFTLETISWENPVVWITAIKN